MRRAIAALAALALAAAIMAGGCLDGSGSFTWVIAGPELETNLWQFAYVRGWQALASGTVYDELKNHSRLRYNRDPAVLKFEVRDTACNFGLGTADGTALVVAAEYTAADGRSYYAVEGIATAKPMPDIPAGTMREVPPATATNASGTVTVTWPAAAAQDEVIGYRVARSEDGIAGWVTVADVGTGTLTRDDTPGAGTWYYAVGIRYQGAPTQQVSPWGLSATVVVE